MMMPLLYLMGVLFIIYYIFAMFGMLFFGGKIQRGLPALINDQSIPDNYHLDNFNDLLSSFVTLFTLMVVNNWMIQVQLYCVVMDSNYYRFYFGLFYYFSVVIGINIVVAFTIDMYSSVERLDQERTNTLELLRDELAANNTIQSPTRDSGARFNSQSS
jgi:two pore calcium channel protein 1